MFPVVIEWFKMAYSLLRFLEMDKTLASVVTVFCDFAKVVGSRKDFFCGTAWGNREMLAKDSRGFKNIVLMKDCVVAMLGVWCVGGTLKCDVFLLIVVVFTISCLSNLFEIMFGLTDMSDGAFWFIKSSLVKSFRIVNLFTVAYVNEGGIDSGAWTDTKGFNFSEEKWFWDCWGWWSFTSKTWNTFLSFVRGGRGVAVDNSSNWSSCFEASFWGERFRGAESELWVCFMNIRLSLAVVASSALVNEAVLKAIHSLRQTGKWFIVLRFSITEILDVLAPLVQRLEILSKDETFWAAKERSLLFRRWRKLVRWGLERWFNLTLFTWFGVKNWFAF